MEDFASSAPWYPYRNAIKSLSLPDGLTNIGSYAFVGCSKLASVTIPSSVDTIDMGAFYNCSSLSTIINYATTPQSIDSWVFQGVKKSTCTLYVPRAALNVYKSTEERFL